MRGFKRKRAMGSLVRVEFVSFFTAVVVGSFTPRGAPAAVFPTASWDTSRTPQSVGLDPARLDQVASLIGGNGVVARYGYLVASWGSPATP